MRGGVHGCHWPVAASRSRLYELTSGHGGEVERHMHTWTPVH